MIPMRSRTIFKNRWWAVLWAIGIIWFALDVAGGPAPADNSTAAAADVPTAPTDVTDVTDVTGAPIHREDIDQLGTIIDGL